MKTHIILVVYILHSCSTLSQDVGVSDYEIHNRIDYYKSDTIFETKVISGKKIRTYRVAYCKVELDSVIKLENSWKYCYSYYYYYKSFDERLIIKSDSGYVGPVKEVFFVNDSALFFCPKISESNLYILFNGNQNNNKVFDLNHEERDCDGYLPNIPSHGEAKVIYGSNNENKGDTHVIFNDPLHMSKIGLRLRQGEGIISFKDHLERNNEYELNRCTKKEIPKFVW